MCCSNTNHNLREQSRKFLLFRAGTVREPHKSRLAAALWAALDYAVTFIAHTVTFIHTPHAPIFLQDLIYIAAVVLFKPIVIYIPVASLQRVTSSVCFYAGSGSNYYRIYWNFTVNLTMFISSYDFNRQFFWWSNLVYYSSWEFLDKNRFIAEMVLQHRDNLSGKVKASVSTNT